MTIQLAQYLLEERGSNTRYSDTLVVFLVFINTSSRARVYAVEVCEQKGFLLDERRIPRFAGKYRN